MYFAASCLQLNLIALKLYPSRYIILDTGAILMQKMLIPLMMLLPILQGCAVGTAVGVVTDVAVEVAKVPFKVGGAAIDVVTGDDDEE
jgi:hypothetical protein